MTDVEKTLAKLIDKLPAFDPVWNPDTAARWFKACETLVGMVRKHEAAPERESPKMPKEVRRLVSYVASVLSSEAQPRVLRGEEVRLIREAISDVRALYREEA